MEMHTVHTAQEVLGNIHYAVMGVLFSVNDYNVNLRKSDIDTIDAFFDSMEWNKIDASHEVSLINYSNFVKILDLTQRWIYKGSLTTPPCLFAAD